MYKMKRNLFFRFSN